jgi:thiol-disulfide isomerase/thioredoxin
MPSTKTRTRNVIVDLNIITLQQLQNLAEEHVIVIKFTAQWCGPCKRIAAQVEKHFLDMPENVICVEIDVDECDELYTLFKNKRMLNGIPAILAFYGDEPRLRFWIPDDSVVGADTRAVKNFIDRCQEKAEELQPTN